MEGLSFIGKAEGGEHALALVESEMGTSGRGAALTAGGAVAGGAAGADRCGRAIEINANAPREGSGMANFAADADGKAGTRHAPRQGGGADGAGQREEALAVFQFHQLAADFARPVKGVIDVPERTAAGDW